MTTSFMNSPKGRTSVLGGKRKPVPNLLSHRPGLFLVTEDLYNKYALYLWFNGFKACIASFFALPLSVLQCFLSQTYSMFML